MNTETEGNLTERRLVLMSFALGRVQDAVYLVDSEARIQYVNEAACRSLGYDPAEFSAMTVLDIDTRMSPRDWREHWEMLRTTGSVVFERELRARDSRIIPVEVTANYFEFEDQPFNLTLARDITERKSAEAEINEQRRHGESLLKLSRRFEVARTAEDVAQAAWEAVRETIGYQNVWVYRFDDATEVASPIAAFGPKRHLILPDDGPFTFRIKGDRMLEEIATASDIVVVEDARNDDRVNPAMVQHFDNRTIINVPIRHFGAYLGAIGTGTYGDEGVRLPTPAERVYLMSMASHLAVTLDRIRLMDEQARAEEVVRQLNQDLEQRVADRTRALEQSNQDLESFSYSVSHDLRAPLRAVTGFAQILADRYAPGLDDQGRHYLDNVIEASRRMTTLIEDLLHYSRTGRGAVRDVPVPLAPLIGHLASTFNNRLTELGAQLEVVEPLATPRADPVLLEQALVNLVDNALTYKSVERPPLIRIASTRDAEGVTITVADNGIGIAPEYHERIFQVFQRLHSADEYPGTGIGLAIVARAVRAMNGRIRVDSTPGTGSVFSIQLPAAD